MYQALFSSPLSGGESKKRTGDEASVMGPQVINCMYVSWALKSSTACMAAGSTKSTTACMCHGCWIQPKPSSHQSTACMAAGHQLHDVCVMAAGITA